LKDNIQPVKMYKTRIKPQYFFDNRKNTTELNRIETKVTKGLKSLLIIDYKLFI